MAITLAWLALHAYTGLIKFTLYLQEFNFVRINRYMAFPTVEQGNIQSNVYVQKYPEKFQWNR